MVFIMNGSKPVATVYEAMRMLLLFLPKPLGHLVDIPAALLRNLGPMLAHFLNHRVDVHQSTSYSISIEARQVVCPPFASGQMFGVDNRVRPLLKPITRYGRIEVNRRSHDIQSSLNRPVSPQGGGAKILFSQTRAILLRLRGHDAYSEKQNEPNEDRVFDGVRADFSSANPKTEPKPIPWTEDP
jgi:hypothetical protein